MSIENNEDYLRGFEEGKVVGVEDGKRIQKHKWDWEEAIAYWGALLLGITVISFGLFLVWNFIHWAAQQDPPSWHTCVSYDGSVMQYHKCTD